MLPSCDAAATAHLSEKLRIQRLTAAILVQRGFSNAESARQFLNPSLDARLVLEHARAGLVSFVPGDAFYTDHAGMHEIRICFASIAPARADDFARALAMGIQTVYGRGRSRATLGVKG